MSVLLSLESVHVHIMKDVYMQKPNALKHPLPSPPTEPARQYMAPELFLEGGIHSFASDLWQGVSGA